MKLLRGTEQLGAYSNIPVLVDWDYLIKERGLRKEREEFERLLGRLLFITAALFFLAATVLGLFTGDAFLLEMFKVDSLVKVVAWGVAFIAIYSVYLTRNRESFIDSLKETPLSELRYKLLHKEAISAITISNYYDHDLLNILDDLLNEDDYNYISNLLLALMKYPLVIEGAVRIGLHPADMEAIAVRFSREFNGYIDVWLKPMLFGSFQIALDFGFPKVDELALFLYLCKEPLKELLLDYKISDKEIQALELWVKNQADRIRYLRLFRQKSALKPTTTINRAYTSRYSPTLVKFSRDFTAEVIKNSFNVSIARDQELEQLIKLTEEGKKSATLLIGEPGVGKTTLLKSLAVRMVVEDVPDVLRDKRLVAFDFNRALALSPRLEKFKERMENAFEETAQTGNIILVLDDLDNLVNIRHDFAAEVVTIIVQAMDKYNLRVIATSTPAGYTRHIKPNEALAALFNTMNMNEPSDEVTVQILMDSLPELERQYKVKVEFEALVTIVRLSHKFNFEKVLPDKALDLLDEVIVQAQSQQLTFVTEQLIEQVVSQKVGVQVGAISEQESQLLLTMEDELHKRVIGQEEAVKAVASALRRSRAGLVSQKRPIASFLFFGPTGVGKTELAKALAKVYYGDDKLMIRLDMSEYQEETNLERLIGAEVNGEFEGGFLTEAVRSKPFSLILLDEIEKANPKVLDVFLQILDEGRVTDGMGRHIDFTNCIIVATSNIASKTIADLLTAGKSYAEVFTAVMPKLREYLRVEFINRFDKVILFKPLSPIEVQQVAKLMMEAERTTLADKGIELMYTDIVLDELVKIGYSPLYGGRELHRIIQENIEDPIAKLIVGGQLKSGGVIKLESLQKFSVEE